jgi:hypothetical protein
MKIKLQITAVILFFTICLLLPETAEATIVNRLHFDEIVDRAETIVSGKVISINHRVIEENSMQVPYTYVTISVLDNLKGQARGGFHTFRMLGGPLPDKGLVLQVSGMPQFEIDQEVFLFLMDDQVLESPIVGFFQGRFNIEFDNSTGSKTIFDHQGNVVTERTIFGDGTRNPYRPVNYEVFKNHVQRKIRNN